MADDREPLSERQVGAVIRRLSEEHAALHATRDAQRAWGRVESSISPAPPAASGSGVGRVAAIGGALALAAALLLALGFRADSQLSYELRGGRAAGGVIEAQRGEAIVALSDGSSILAENRTKFSVDVVGRNAALTRLVSGKLHVRVTHNEDTSYRFIAGPYEVRVVGTEFDLAWEPSGSGLWLSMSKGEVRLVEPGGKLRTLKSGEALHLPWLFDQIDGLQVDGRWHAVARGVLRDELATQQRLLTDQVLSMKGGDADAKVRNWIERDDAALRFTLNMLNELAAQKTLDYPTASVAVQRLSQLSVKQ